MAVNQGDLSQPAGVAGQDGPARLYDADEPMADGEVRMTAAENVLGWLLIEKVGVPDDRNYTPKEAQDILARRLQYASDLENERSALAPATAGEQVKALKWAEAHGPYGWLIMPEGLAEDAWYLADTPESGTPSEPLYSRRDLMSIRSALIAPPEVAWCQPMHNGEHTPRQFIVRFEDADNSIAVFDDEGEARAFWAKSILDWNCYLFGSLPLYAAPPAAGARAVPVGPVPTYECGFRIGQLVRLAQPYLGADQDAVFYVTGITWEHRMVPARGWNIMIAGKEDIEKGYGQTDGFQPADLLPASPVGEER